ncbi:MAG: aminopeptidase [Eubacteriales bacterium]|nr:aminopeptidase [Eubacteriales bacterium]
MDFRDRNEIIKPEEVENAVLIDQSPAFYAERFALCREKLGILSAEPLSQPYAAYFEKLLGFLNDALSAFDGNMSDEAGNARLYAELTKDGYERSFLNPVYAKKQLGQEFGPLLSVWYTELRGILGYCFEKNMKHVTVMLETFIQIYNEFEQNGENTDYQTVKDVMYSYLYDYCAEFTEDYVRDGLAPSASLAQEIVMQADLTNPSYLYRYGEWITDAEVQTARLMASLSEAEITAMADAYTEGYLKGFQRAGKEIRKKKTVLVTLPLGFERFMRKSVQNFRKAGLSVIFRRYPAHLTDKGLFGNVKPGFYGAENRQYVYDHAGDMALFMGDRLRAEKEQAFARAYAACAAEAKAFSGTACVEIFGEDGFVPASSEEPLLKLSGRQQGLFLKLRQKRNETESKWMPEDETSFTIIAWPGPQIAADFAAYAELFHDVIRINTLPEDDYREIQQKLIDALDRADRVEITGAGANRTRLSVKLHELKNPAKETNFENCLADVNVPVGEVFTSPRLAGTDGELFVSNVYLSGYQFRDLYLRFQDGRVTDYGCSNFASEEENRRLIEDRIFKNQTSLPMGEFAIGTNTTAFAVSRIRKIGAKLPVLIAEKTGPHFAVGDTCYAHEEEFITYNPDGKAITARENECSALRRDASAKAYFNVHVDITVPYDEIAVIRACHADGSSEDIIRDGRFVLAGTEMLNEALDRMKQVK